MAERAADPVPPEIERAKQVFRFLKAFAERSLPIQRRLADQPWSMVLAELPQHPSIAIGEVQMSTGGANDNGAEDADDATPLVRVRRPTLTRAPRPPVPIGDWMQAGWEDPDGRIEVRRERNERRHGETVTISFDEAAERPAALAQYRVAWSRWAEAERPTRAAMRVFERLYDPALFLRARLSGFPAAFDRVLEDLEDRENLTISLTRLVGIASLPTDRQPSPPVSPWSEPPDVLLSKPANIEQVEIARALGAITLLGDEQAGLIQDLTVRLVGAVELDHRRFAAGNSAQFQGDERHVVFLSMVDSPVGAPLAFRQTVLFKQRYNVAASRAKDQLWLVHSLDPGRDLKAGDLRRALIEHVRDPGGKRRAIQDAQRRAESPFETAVIGRLIAAGYRVEPQVWVGQYRIDMVVSDGRAQAAVECDGDRFHGVDAIPLDMARQAVLERAGWRFIRIRGTRFYRDPDRTMAWVLKELERLCVAPGGATVSASDVDEQARGFRERVVKRAWEVMREQGWLSSEQNGREGTAARASGSLDLFDQA